MLAVSHTYLLQEITIMITTHPFDRYTREQMRKEGLRISEIYDGPGNEDDALTEASYALRDYLRTLAPPFDQDNRSIGRFALVNTCLRSRELTIYAKSDMGTSGDRTEIVDAVTDHHLSLASRRSLQRLGSTSINPNVVLVREQVTDRGDTLADTAVEVAAIIPDAQISAFVVRQQHAEHLASLEELDVKYVVMSSGLEPTATVELDLVGL